VSSKGADAIIAAIDSGEQVEFTQWKNSPSLTPSGADLESPHFAKLTNSHPDSLSLKDTKQIKCS
jgi:hypothetical protein